MGINSIDASLCARMFLTGARNLDAKKDWINELNVFPVPDGDTGTNMTMTIMSAAKEVKAIDDMQMAKVAKAMSSGSLRGARGNSGVILSQLLRGFSKVVRDKDLIDAQTMVEACVKASETAYKAVMKPKEGTILTVARGISDEAAALYAENPDITLEELITDAIRKGDEVLAQTPEMLPVLKEAGVVDSGGQGLMCILKGALAEFNGTVDSLGLDVAEEAAPEAASRYGYITDLVLVPSSALESAQETQLREYFKAIGDQISMEKDGVCVKIHVQTDDPGIAIQKAMKFGALSSITVTNVHADQVVKEAEIKSEAESQESAPAASDEPRKEVGFVAVSIGEGLGQIFRDLGVDQLIEGGQTMNPSTDDVLQAIDKVNADTVFVFPNNKNIILAASQAQKLAEGKQVIVIPTKTIPQGITALINYVPEKSAEENERAMYDEIGNVRTGELTYAVRDTRIDDKEIHVGDYMGVGDKGILAVGTDLDDTAVETVKEMMTDDAELISVYYGADMTEETAQKLCDRLAEEFDGCDVELNPGGQPVYYYIISVE